jgi:opacity protein-like surface antigen
VSDGVTTTFRLTGRATLLRQIGRTWTAALSYERIGGTEARFTAPVFTDEVVGVVQGQLGRRVRLSTSVGFMVGDIGLSGDSDFQTARASAGVNIALSRSWAGAVTYEYYDQSFPDTPFIVTGVVREAKQQFVFAGLNVWVPLLSRTRKP